MSITVGGDTYVIIQQNNIVTLDTVTPIACIRTRGPHPRDTHFHPPIRSRGIERG